MIWIKTEGWRSQTVPAAFKHNHLFRSETRSCLQTGYSNGLSGETNVSFIKFSSGHHVGGKSVMRLTSVWNASPGFVKSYRWPELTQSLWPLWPGCCIITGGSWPLCGLLCVSPGSAGCSWSSDLCCWTPLFLSGHHTPPESKVVRKMRKFDSKDSDRRGEKTQK